MRIVSIAAVFFASAAFGQATVPTENGTGAVLRSLDRITGEVMDHEVQSGESFTRAKITVDLAECRFPEGEPEGEAFARMVIRDSSLEKPVFDGWMIASSPALSALEHPRYDVWVLKCMTSSTGVSSES